MLNSASFIVLSTTLVLMATETSAICSNLTLPAGNTTDYNSYGIYSAAGPVQRVSKAVWCPETSSADCQVDGHEGYYYNRQYLNITQPIDSANVWKWLANLTGPSPIDWTKNTDKMAEVGKDSVSTFTVLISPGHGGYIEFTPVYRCINAILHGCSGDGPVDGAGVQACKPIDTAGNTPNGLFNFVKNATQAEVANMTTNPALLVTPTSAGAQKRVSLLGMAMIAATVGILAL